MADTKHYFFHSSHGPLLANMNTVSDLVSPRCILDSCRLQRLCLNLLSCLVLSCFPQKNGTHEGEFVFHTGEENYMDFGKIDTWNGLR